MLFLSLVQKKNVVITIFVYVNMIVHMPMCVCMTYVYLCDVDVTGRMLILSFLLSVAQSDYSSEELKELFSSHGDITECDYKWGYGFLKVQFFWQTMLRNTMGLLDLPAKPWFLSVTT